MEHTRYHQKALRVSEISQRLDVSLSTVYRLLESGTLPGCKIGRVWRVPPEVVEEYLRAAVRSPRADDLM